MHKFSYKIAKLLSLSLASTVILSLSPAQPPTQDVPLLKRIRDYWKEGDFSLAKKQIRLYLEKNPEGTLSEELHLLLGDLYLQEGNFVSALEEYAFLKSSDLQEKSFYNEALCLYETKQYKDLLTLTNSLSSQKQLSSDQKHTIRYLCAISLKESLDPDLADKAIALFESCKNTSFSTKALSALISLYLSSGDEEKAADCYQALAKENVDQAPDLLFQAAVLKAKTDPSLALELFQKVLSSSSLHKPAAAYNRLILLYETKQFNDLILAYEETSLLFSPEEKEEASYLVGKSLYHLQEHEKAIVYLMQTVENPTFSEDLKIEAGLMALTSAKQLKSKDLYKKIWNDVQSFSLEETKKTKMHLNYLDLLKDEQDQNELAQESEQFLVNFPTYADLRPVQLNRIYGLYHSNQWELAKSALQNFMMTYPDHLSSELLRLQMNCTTKLLENNASYRKEWIELAKVTLQTPNLLNPEEREHYLLELTKNLFLEGLFSDALYTTGEFLIDFPSSSFLEEVELIQVLCYLEDPESHLLFALQAEKFLDHHPNNIQAPTLRIHLFNTYLNQASSTKEPLQSELLDKAATHLYIVFDQKQHKILKENLQWLADYYYNLSSFTKATVLFEHLLQDPSLEASTEENIYKLSTLFSKNFELEKKIALLEKWTTNKNSINTPLQKHFLFDLAGTYKALNNSDKALELYDLLILSSGHSKIGAESLLERSKILFSRFTEEEKAEDNPLCMEIIHHIKDLENQKNLSSEPLHLEAALEYVEYKASLVKDLSLRREKRQELLKLCQENTDSFYSEEQLQDKKEIFSAYKKFIEAQILLCDPTSSENKERSILLLQKLKEDCSIPASLQERVQASLELNSSL